MFETTTTRSFVIPNGASGAAVPAADLGLCCKAVVLRCADCAGIAAGSMLAVYAGEGAGDELCAAYNPETGAALALPMPSSGSWRVALPDLFGARRARLVLSANVTADTTFEVCGVDAGV
jgi:hypothetical protein